MAVAPDFVEPRVGWRVWSVVSHDGQLRLASLVYHALWPPQAELEARCRRPLAALPWARLPLHGTPDAECCCGIYGVSTFAGARPYLRTPIDSRLAIVGRVVGTVSLWGRIVECSDGWRAAFAYPERILVPQPRRRRLARRPPSADAIAAELAVYGVPVEVVAWRCP